MFKTILIANRGEIACRIIKTAQSMGINTVAVYSTADEESLHVHMADKAFCVGAAPAKDSYLNIDAIIKAAKDSNADAIHPGYGFLSENPKFADACAQAGIIFIGPTIDALETMGSKQLAKQLLQDTSVPLTPGYHGQEQSEAHLLKQAKKIGFPVLLKAANGGGGKGMRAVMSESEFASALAAAKREAMASFADDIIIIEKLLLNPRHVEVQIMADNFGSVVHLFERDCSIQRRHQKIIEEAPAPNLSPALRKQLAQAACEVARTIKYRGAGTIEFLVDKDANFYFMEMNTRLQVEHPVTEFITGIDLVSWQIHIAFNDPLPLTQEQIHAQGHALECRIYAEDPAHGFIPSIGTIKFLQQPVGEGIRIDTGVTQSSTISRYYDPMIAKLITWGETRAEALQKMQRALTQYYIAGVKTNIPFLQAICQHPQFMEAQLSTNFLEKQSITLASPNKEISLFMAVAFDYQQMTKKLCDPLLKETFAWQQQGLGNWTWRYQIEGELMEAVITPIDMHKFHVQDKKNALQQTVEVHENPTHLTVSLNEQHYKSVVYSGAEHLFLFTELGQTHIERFTWDNQGNTANNDKNQLAAPMPATVVAVLKKIGEQVKAGERLLILEAMKMEHTIHAPNDGVLEKIFYSIGSQVNEGAQLVALSKLNE